LLALLLAAVGRRVSYYLCYNARQRSTRGSIPAAVRGCVSCQLSAVSCLAEMSLAIETTAEENYEEDTLGFEPIEVEEDEEIQKEPTRTSPGPAKSPKSSKSPKSPKSPSASSKFGSPSSLSSKGSKKGSLLKHSEIQQKLESLNTQLADICVLNRALKDKAPSSRVYGLQPKAPKTDYSHPLPSKNFSHPKLEYVLGHLMHSPYRTLPQDQYPRTSTPVPPTVCRVC
jgi:hypothetical protein